MLSDTTVNPFSIPLDDDQSTILANNPAANVAKKYHISRNLSNSIKDGSPPSYTEVVLSDQNDSLLLNQRQQELNRKESTLEGFEASIRHQEEEFARRNAGQQGATRVHNWPPLPSFSRVRPCFYHNIEEEIPPRFHNLMNFAYSLWFSHVCAWVANVFASFGHFFITGSSNEGSSAAASLLVLGVFTPLSFLCWYRPLYMAFKYDSSVNFFIFFITFGFQIFIVGVQSLGLDWFAGCGLINGIHVYSKSYFGGTVMLMCGLMLATLTFLDIFLFIKVHHSYRGNGGSLARVRDELGGGIVSNPFFRDITLPTTAPSATERHGETINGAT